MSTLINFQRYERTMERIVLSCTVKIVSKFASFYRFGTIVLSLQTSKLSVFSFYRFIVLSFHRFIILSFLVRNIEFILSFYRCKESIKFFYRFIIASFYRCRPIVLSLQTYRFIVAFYRFVVVGVNLETILTVFFQRA